MTWNMHIKDGTGTGFTAKVSRDHALYVTGVGGDLPAVGTPSRLRYFQQKMNKFGDTADFDMNVDGSVTPVAFVLSSNAEYDIHVASIVISYSDSAIVNNRFGNIAGVTNGFDLDITELGVTVPLLTSVKTGGEMIIQSSAYNLFAGATGTAINEISNFTGNTDAQVVVIPVGQYVEGGIRLGRGTVDRFTAYVNDDFTGLDLFNVTMFGERAYDVGEDE